MNSICKDCIFCGVSCSGTNCETWTGCVYRKTAAQIDVDALPVLAFNNAVVGGLYRWCEGWQIVTRIYSITEEEAAEDHLCYLDRYESIDSFGFSHDAAFHDGRITHGRRLQNV